MAEDMFHPKHRPEQRQQIFGGCNADDTALRGSSLTSLCEPGQPAPRSHP